MDHRPSNQLYAMRPVRTIRWQRILAVLIIVLILKVTVSVVAGYRDYFPPNFKSDFLLGRQTYFFGAYQWAFYSHIVAGPVSLILGLVLVSEEFRRRFPPWHRLLGKFEAGLVLLVLVPSGLWMAYYAQTGVAAAIGLASLAIATGTCVAMGWRTAVKRRFVEHRRWMMRCFLLLCSAVILRIIGGLVTVTGIGDVWGYALATWVSWLLPLATFELTVAIRRQMRVAQIADDHVSNRFDTPLPAPTLQSISP